jgi:hypothetical protein
MQVSWGEETTCAYTKWLSEGAPRRGASRANGVREKSIFRRPIVIDSVPGSMKVPISKKGSLEHEEK